MKPRLKKKSSVEQNEPVKINIPKVLSVLPLRDIIIYPYMIFPVLIGRASSLKAVTEALEKDKYLFVATQKNIETEEPNFADIYTYGTTARILQVIKLPNSMVKVLVEGLYLSKIKKKIKNEEFLLAEITSSEINYDLNDPELEALIRANSNLFAQYIKNNLKLPSDLYSAFENITDPIRKLYFAAANIQQNLPQMQKLLEMKTLKDQYFELSKILASEIDVLKIEEEIDTKVQNSIQKSQKKYYIQEQIRALQTELGPDDDTIPEIINLKSLIDNSGMPENIMSKALDELEKLRKTPSMSPEFAVNRSYLEYLCQMPWKNRTEDDFDIAHVKAILDEDHYDLEKPKERILEFIAILNIAGNIKKQILCFIGPPGVGKTSLGKSIARALGRKFVRFSLGGIRDEAEIRGHRRTYIGAMPGKIIQSMKKAGSTNPVILLDEVDKMSMDFRGDPSSALLEVLDPEQNIAFNDHYLEVDYDLSNVLFITTANVRHEIPLPLQDRMEIISLSSYLEPEKLEIAKRHLIPKLMLEFGLENINISFTDGAILKLITQYTRESGVRNLERELSSILRKLTKEIVIEFSLKNKIETANIDRPDDRALKNNPGFMKFIKKKKYVITEKEIEKYLKSPKFKSKPEDLIDKVGVATGLAWTSVGGDILPIEVTIMSGIEKLTLTGKLGEVMKESAKAALSYIRSNYSDLGVDEGFYKKKEIHIHIPEGAIPKDGPSAGITLTTAMVSAASNKAVRGDVAMTGEITLRGNILPVGGLNEKLLSAKRYGYKTVIVPFENISDIEEMNHYIKEGLEIIPVKHYTEAIKHIFK